MAHMDAADRRRQVIAAARSAFARDGVARTSQRSVAAEAGIPLGNLQYVFPTKESLYRAVIEDVVEGIEAGFASTLETSGSFANSIRHGLGAFWDELIANDLGQQVMQYELTMYALRTDGQVDLARWQYERYAELLASWCQRAADHAGATLALPVDQLARAIQASIDGLILQHVCDPDEVRSRRTLDNIIEMSLALAGVDKCAGSDRFAS